MWTKEFLAVHTRLLSEHNLNTPESEHSIYISTSRPWLNESEHMTFNMNKPELSEYEYFLYKLI